MLAGAQVGGDGPGRLLVAGGGDAYENQLRVLQGACVVGGGQGGGKEAHHAGAAPEQDAALFVHVVHLALEVPAVAQGHPEALAGEKRGGGVACAAAADNGDAADHRNYLLNDVAGLS